MAWGCGAAGSGRRDHDFGPMSPGLTLLLASLIVAPPMRDASLRDQALQARTRQLRHVVARKWSSRQPLWDSPGAKLARILRLRMNVRSWLEAKPRRSPSYRGLLALVIVLGVLIVLGVIGLIVAAVSRAGSARPCGCVLCRHPAYAAGERIESAELDGNRILLRLGGPEGEELVVRRRGLGPRHGAHRGRRKRRDGRGSASCRCDWPRAFWARRRAPIPNECCGLIEGMAAEDGWRALDVHETANLAENRGAAFPHRSAGAVRSDAGLARETD